MPVHLHFSNRFEALAERLTDKLAPGAALSDPLHGPILSTPTPALRRSLQMQVARQRGIAAGLEFQPFESALWGQLARLDQFRESPEREPARLLGSEGMRLLLLSALRGGDWPELRSYLHQSDAFPLPLSFQLADELSGLFREYEYGRVAEHGRPSLSDTWSRQMPWFDAHALPRLGERARIRLRTLEAWQSRLYATVFAENGLRDRLGEETGRYRYTLPQYAAMVLSQSRQGRIPPPLPEFHLFGLSQISPFHRNLLIDLGGEAPWGADIHVYAFNPCAEFWEDVRGPSSGWQFLTRSTAQERRLPESDLQAEEFVWPEEENPLLALWGRPGRESVQLWMQVTEYDFEEGFVAPQDRHVLAEVQRGVLHRRRSPERRLPADESLRWGAAEDGAAESEAVYRDIAQALAADPGLRPQDIAIVPMKPETHIPLLKMAFGEKDPFHSHAIPLALPEGDSLALSDYGRAGLALLDLLPSRWEKADLLAWFEMAPVQRRFGWTADQIEAMADTLDNLPLLDFLDGSQKSEAGLAAPSSRTWTHTLDRLAWSRILPTAEHFSSASPWPLPLEAVAWEESLAALTACVESWEKHVPLFRSSRTASLREWAQRLRSLFDDCLAADESDDFECLARRSLRKTLESWEGFVGKDSPGFAAAEAMALLRKEWSEAQALRQPFPGSGVLVASLAALRGLTFRRIYLLGMDEDFPAPSASSALDLRPYRRVVGDPDPAAAQRFQCLEALLAAKDALWISYVDHDEEKDAPVAMSPLLADLRRHLEMHVLERPTLDLHVPEKPGSHPSPSHASAQEPNTNGEPATDFPATPLWPKMVLQDSRLPSGPSNEVAASVNAGRSGSEVSETSRPPHRQEIPADPLASRSLPVRASRLAELLEDPFAYTIRRRFPRTAWTVWDREKGIDEAFLPGKKPLRLEALRTLRHCLESFSVGRGDFDAPSLEERIQEGWRRFRRSGQVPEGAYEPFAEARFRERILAWVKFMHPGPSGFAWMGGMRFGSADVRRQWDYGRRYPAWEISSGIERFALHAAADLIVVPADPKLPIGVSESFVGKEKDALPPRPMVFLYAALAAECPESASWEGRPVHLFAPDQLPEGQRENLLKKAPRLPDAASAHAQLQRWMDRWRESQEPESRLWDMPLSRVRKSRKSLGSGAADWRDRMELEREGEEAEPPGEYDSPRDLRRRQWSRLMAPALPAEVGKWVEDYLLPFLPPSGSGSGVEDEENSDGDFAS